MPILCTTSKQKENYYNAAGLQGVGVSLLFVLLLVHAQDQTGTYKLLVQIIVFDYFSIYVMK